MSQFTSQLTNEQLKEIERRSNSIKSSEAKTISWESIVKKLKHRYENK